MQHNKKKMLFAVGFLLLAYGACVGVGFPMTSILYPKWASSSQKYIPITVAISTLSLVSHLLNTVVIRFYKTSFQVMIQSVNLVIYLTLSLTMMKFWSLWGFCIGGALAGAIRLLILLVIILRAKATPPPEASDGGEVHAEVA